MIGQGYSQGNMSCIVKLKLQLRSEFDMKELGATSRILGMETNRDRIVGKLSLSKEVY